MTNTKAEIGTSTPSVVWVSPWSPINNQSLASALATPAAYANYLQEVTYLGQAMQNLTADSWSQVTSTDELIVMTHTDQVGTFTITGTPSSSDLPEVARRKGAAWLGGDDSNNYLYEVTFVGSNTGTQHSMSVYMSLTGASALALAAIFRALATFLPALLNNIYTSVSGVLGNLLNSTAATDTAAADAATTAGVDLAVGVATAFGLIGAGLLLAGLILQFVKRDFELQVSIINQSRTNYLILPNYYLEGGAASLVAAANSCAYVNTYNQELPATICTAATNLYPFSGCAQAFDGTNVQATEYQVVYQHSGYYAPGVFLQLIESAYTDPATTGDYGTLAPTNTDAGWTGLVINPHYHTDDAPNIALFVAGANLANAETWYKQYIGTPPSSTGSIVAETTTLNWVLAAGDPIQLPSAGDAWTWRIAITITDNA